MTRRRVCFVTQKGIRYVSPEYNGDKEEFELFGMKDTCEKNWSEIMNVFNAVKTFPDFVKALVTVASYYKSQFGSETEMRTTTPYKLRSNQKMFNDVDKIIYIYEKDESGNVIADIPVERKAELYNNLLSHLNEQSVSDYDLYLVLNNLGFSRNEMRIEGVNFVSGVSVTFDENISDKFLAKAETCFGVIYVEIQAGEDEKLRIYDSLGRYMGYFENETFAEIADKNKFTIANAVFEFCYELINARSIGDLLIQLGEDGLASSSKSKIAEKLGLPVDCTEEELLKNEFVNKIGETYVVFDD